MVVTRIYLRDYIYIIMNLHSVLVTFFCIVILILLDDTDKCNTSSLLTHFINKNIINLLTMHYITIFHEKTHPFSNIQLVRIFSICNLVYAIQYINIISSLNIKCFYSKTNPSPPFFFNYYTFFSF